MPAICTCLKNPSRYIFKFVHNTVLRNVAKLNISFEMYRKMLPGNSFSKFLNTCSFFAKLIWIYDGLILLFQFFQNLINRGFYLRIISLHAVFKSIFYKNVRGDTCMFQVFSIQCKTSPGRKAY